MITSVGAAVPPAQAVFVGGIPMAAARAESARSTVTPPAVMAVPIPTIYLDLALRIRSVNRAFEERFVLPYGVLEGRHFLTSDGARWDHPELHALLARLIDTARMPSGVDSCTIHLAKEGIELRISARRVFDGCARLAGHGLICLTLEEAPVAVQPVSTASVSAPPNEFLASLSLEMQQALHSLAGAINLLSRIGDPQVKGDICMLSAQMPRLHRICADLDRYATWQPDGDSSIATTLPTTS